MGISRAVVDRVKRELDPPGRFLEKDNLTGLWHEVDDRRALEKAAQALRDGAAPLRKQIARDMSDPAFLETLFDDEGVGLGLGSGSGATTTVESLGETVVSARGK